LAASTGFGVETEVGRRVCDATLEVPETVALVEKLSLQFLDVLDQLIEIVLSKADGLFETEDAVLLVIGEGHGASNDGVSIDPGCSNPRGRIRVLFPE